MRQTFSDPELQEQFEANGFVKVPFLSEAEVRSLLALYERLHPGTEAKPFHATMHLDDPTYKTEVDQEIKKIIGARSRKLLKGYRPLFANFLVKSPGDENEVPLHQDWNYVDESRFTSINIWIPLVETDENNGGLGVIEGSHKLSTPIRYTPYEPPPHEKFREILTGLCDVIPTQLGEAIIYNSRLLHFSGANSSDKIRPAVAYVNIPEDAKPLHYYRAAAKPEKLQVFEVDEQFFTQNPLFEAPKGYKLIEEIEPDPAGFTLKEVLKMHNFPLEFEIKEVSRTQKVEKYYDEWTSRYLEVYGDIIQAYRPGNNAELLDYTLNSAGIEDGMRLLDAGCGVGGPALHFAENRRVQIQGLTLSGVQVAEAQKKIATAKAEGKVNIRKGDYHVLDELYEPESFDMVLFLEALGHASHPDQAIRAAAKVLKPGGFIYIKDFFPIEHDDSFVQERVKKVIGNINEMYSYNTLDLHETLSSLRKAGFLIVFMKRPEYESDINIRKEFEDRFGIDTHGGMPEFLPAEWLEIKCQKLWFNNGYQGIE